MPAPSPSSEEPLIPVRIKPEDQGDDAGEQDLQDEVDQPRGQPRAEAREPELDLDSLRRRDRDAILILHRG